MRLITSLTYRKKLFFKITAEYWLIHHTDIKTDYIDFKKLISFYSLKGVVKYIDHPPVFI